MAVVPDPLGYLRDAVRKPAYHSGSYQSITGLFIGIKIVRRESAGVSGVATP